MEFFHNWLVYLTYTIYLLLVIVGLFTENDMPQIAVINLATNYAVPTPASVALEPISAVPNKNAEWATTSFPEIGRTRLEYTRRGADPGTGLIRHSYKVTIPTLKSVVTDPSGPYVPAPVLDYPTVVEVNLWVHPRSTVVERQAAIAAIFKSDKVDSTFTDAIYNAAAGQTYY